MNIILFIHQTASEKGANLKSALNRHFPKTKLQIIKTYKTLKKELEKCSDFSEKQIFILLVDSKHRLNKLTLMIDLMEDKRIILILPDESKKTLSTASQFFPRFFTPVSHNYDDLCEVITRMISQGNINANHCNKGGNKNARR